MIKIVMLDGLTLGSDMDLSSLNKYGDFQIYDETSKNEIYTRVKDIDIIITSKCTIDKNVIDECNKLKLVCVSATGKENIDEKYLNSKGIQVKNVVNYSSNSVAQITFSLIFQLLSKISLYNEFVTTGEYSNSNSPSCNHINFVEIAGKTIGIIGLGKIGKKIAMIAEAFGMKVVYFSTTGLNNSNSYKQVSINELFQNSDIISVNCSLTKKTENLINYDLLKKMKKSAIIINTARGKILNENDIITVLSNNLIYGAGIDVFSEEPLPHNHIYFKYNGNNLILTPHIAWSSSEAKQNLVRGIEKNITDFLENNNEYDKI